jgi:hypothetical protein
MTDDEQSPPRDEPTVRQLLADPKTHGEALDAATLAELQRWFGMPSAMDLPPEPAPEQLSRRDAALAAVDPAFLGYLGRVEARLPTMMEEPSVELRANVNLFTTPEQFAAAGKLGEPREIEVSYLLIDDLRECVPQALLRDLHRLEEYFSIYYELNQVDAGIPDVRREIASAIEKGEQDRAVVTARDELALAITDRAEVHGMTWASVAKPAAESAPDPERAP